MISIFEMFKIGIGPSSSHTVGPMKACYEFVKQLAEQNLLSQVDKIQVEVYGSLSLTGLGHCTDVAIIMGLAGYLPDTVPLDLIPETMQRVKQDQRLTLWQYAGQYGELVQQVAEQGQANKLEVAGLTLAPAGHDITFDYGTNLHMRKDFKPKHENALEIFAYSGDKLLHSNTYYSIGGGFIVDEANFGKSNDNQVQVPYPYATAADMLNHCDRNGYSISHTVLQNELALRSKDEVLAYCQRVWKTMEDCIERGMHTEGILPGPLRVKRRAPALRKMLEADKIFTNDPMQPIDWVNMYALAVNEENAASGRVVTAPTNGACGIIPAVLAYYQKFVGSLNPDLIVRYFLVSSFIGSLYKMNASISGAEVGCQGEVGVACSMAAAGLTEIMGGNPTQVCIAAEIGMEHNLGLTCDPVGGQVQVPCIERNAIAAVKAINASRMALRRTSNPHVSLDNVIETMFETGKDMHTKYRETSQGGLAIKIVSICD